MNYDQRNWDLIQAQLAMDHTAIDPMNRAQILNNAFHLARAGMLDYTTALGIASYLPKERSYIVWSAAKKAFSYLGEMLKRTEAYGAYKVQQLLNPLPHKFNYCQI